MNTPVAMCQIRNDPHYRKDAFLNGLRKAGYNVVPSARPTRKEDLLIIWNRYGGFESMADTWERSGGTVLVAENGYIGKDENGHQLYALSASGHNGSGWWVSTGKDRFGKLGVDVKPWKESTPDGHLLVCGQRGIGSRTMASPSNWHYQTANKLKKVTSRPVKVRLHPGNQPPKTALDDDLAGAHACVIWSSGSGVKALVNGYPVFFDAPHWICSMAADHVRNPSVDYEVPNRDDRLRELALFRMAEAQWSIKELDSGEPFDLFKSTIQSGKIPL